MQKKTFFISPFPCSPKDNSDHIISLCLLSIKRYEILRTRQLIAQLNFPGSFSDSLIHKISENLSKQLSVEQNLFLLSQLGYWIDHLKDMQTVNEKVLETLQACSSKIVDSIIRNRQFLKLSVSKMKDIPRVSIKDVFKELMEMDIDALWINRSWISNFLASINLDDVPENFFNSDKGWQFVRMMKKNTMLRCRKLIDVNYRNREGKTILHVMCEMTESEKVKVLVEEMNANIFATDIYEKIPRDYISSWYELHKYLKQREEEFQFLPLKTIKPILNFTDTQFLYVNK